MRAAVEKHYLTAIGLKVMGKVRYSYPYNSTNNHFVSAMNVLYDTNYKYLREFIKLCSDFSKYTDCTLLPKLARMRPDANDHFVYVNKSVPRPNSTNNMYDSNTHFVSTTDIMNVFLENELQLRKNKNKQKEKENIKEEENTKKGFLTIKEIKTKATSELGLMATVMFTGLVDKFEETTSNICVIPDNLLSVLVFILKKSVSDMGYGLPLSELHNLSTIFGKFRSGSTLDAETRLNNRLSKWLLKPESTLPGIEKIKKEVEKIYAGLGTPRNYVSLKDFVSSKDLWARTGSSVTKSQNSGASIDRSKDDLGNTKWSDAIRLNSQEIYYDIMHYNMVEGGTYQIIEKPEAGGVRYIVKTELISYICQKWILYNMEQSLGEVPELYAFIGKRGVCEAQVTIDNSFQRDKSTKVSIDYAGWDEQQVKELMDYNADRISAKMYEWFELDDLDKQGILVAVQATKVQRLLMPSGAMRLITNGLPSGHAWTTLINSVDDLSVIRATGVEYIFCYVLGDDAIISVKDTRTAGDLLRGIEALGVEIARHKTLVSHNTGDFLKITYNTGSPPSGSSTRMLRSLVWSTEQERNSHGVDAVQQRASNYCQWFSRNLRDRMFMTSMSNVASMLSSELKAIITTIDPLKLVDWMLNNDVINGGLGCGFMLNRISNGSVVYEVETGYTVNASVLSKPGFVELSQNSDYIRLFKAIQPMLPSTEIAQVDYEVVRRSTHNPAPLFDYYALFSIVTAGTYNRLINSAILLQPNAELPIYIPPSPGTFFRTASILLYQDVFLGDVMDDVKKDDWIHDNMNRQYGRTSLINKELAVFVSLMNASKRVKNLVLSGDYLNNTPRVLSIMYGEVVPLFWRNMRSVLDSISVAYLTAYDMTVYLYYIFNVYLDHYMHRLRLPVLLML